MSLKNKLYLYLGLVLSDKVSPLVKIVFFKRYKLLVIGLAVLYQLLFHSICFGQETEIKDDHFKDWSIEKKVGQMLILGLPDKILSTESKSHLKKIMPGAIIFFKHNIGSYWQIHELNNSLQYSANKLGLPPLFIMLDQEGGAVVRIKTTPSLPTALAMGSSGDPENIYNIGLHMGRILQLIGFNMNLAPVLDMSDQERLNFVGNRSFGLTPSQISQAANSYATGLSQSGIIPIGKHYPGHGKVTQDSHKTTPIRLDTLEELLSADLKPFLSFQGQPFSKGIMVAHLSLPNIDPSGIPAAFSSTLIQQILRDQLKFNELVLTDDLEMLGADKAGDLGERAVKAIEAGCDLVMVAWSRSRQERVSKAIVAAVKSGRISEDRLHQSLKRILSSKYGLPKISLLKKQDLFMQLKSVFVPLAAATEKVSRKNFENSSARLDFNTLKGKQDFSEIKVFTSDPQFVIQFSSAIQRTDVKRIILNKSNLYSATRNFKPDEHGFYLYYVSGSMTAKALNELAPKQKAKLFIINAAYPGALEGRQFYRGIIDLNTPESRAGTWFGELLKSRLAPGELLNINPSSRLEASEEY